MKKSCIDAQMMRCERLIIVGLRGGSGRLRKYCKEIIRQDMAHLSKAIFFVKEIDGSSSQKEKNSANDAH
ncbi:hypothetical protein H5410_050520 [Solanum commersonii]|uniref:Uncharacterized protein n=1 Tax=Solanum commersonii TaxID=4109 RepID=A0A9J5WXA6_SOLCO|nr:hypothetical protein H5410_050520 [Solanum commersonii]